MALDIDNIKRSGQIKSVADELRIRMQKIGNFSEEALKFRSGSKKGMFPEAEKNIEIIQDLLIESRVLAKELRALEAEHVS